MLPMMLPALLHLMPFITQQFVQPSLMLELVHSLQLFIEQVQRLFERLIS
jgi:hypothetical protein